MKTKIVAVFSICIAFITAPGAVPDFAARADDLASAVYSGVNSLRQTCGVIGNDPGLTAAAQRHADDMLMSGERGHIGSDGSSPQARIADAGYNTRTGYTAEIVYWGTGSRATPGAALDLWMGSPPHRDVILNCAYTLAGFAIASNGYMMAAVGDFGAP